MPWGYVVRGLMYCTYVEGLARLHPNACTTMGTCGEGLMRASSSRERTCLS